MPEQAARIADTRIMIFVVGDLHLATAPELDTGRNASIRYERASIERRPATRPPVAADAHALLRSRFGGEIPKLVLSEMLTPA
jgi:hypothetical protein